ncbi:hypothetical protein [Streptomyces sp. NPDC101206]|uniref:hypothetical protein n=1 Tax=Streptomyces sp. NPDC101206 TaxID=3366128 RepID=UPI00381673FC
MRRARERSAGWIGGSVHIPLHLLHRRLADVPGAGRDVAAVDDTFDAARDAGLPLVTDADR